MGLTWCRKFSWAKSAINDFEHYVLLLSVNRSNNNTALKYSNDIWVNKEVQTGNDMGWEWSGDGGGNGQSICLWVCVLFPGVHPGDRLGKRPLGLPEVWAGAKKSKTKIEGKGSEGETFYLRIKHMLERTGGMEDREGVRGRRSRIDEEMVWTKSFTSEKLRMENKNIHMLSHTHSDWNHMLTERKLGMVWFVPCTGMQSGRDTEGGWKAPVTVDDDQPWEILGPLRCVDRSGPLAAKRRRGLPLCETHSLSSASLKSQAPRMF